MAPAPIDEVVATIKSEMPDLVFAPHVETASGMILPTDYMKAVADAVHSVGGMFVLDCVASGTIWVDMKDVGVDVLISAPQKGWSASPCGGLVMLGAEAKEGEGGWQSIGDLGYLDEEGYLYLVERRTDMIVAGGANVYPAEVENVLYELEAIREVAVIGVPNERWGETGCAVVALQEGAELSAEDILGHCRPHLARFKQPNHVVFVDALPRNATGKVLKFELRQTIEV